MVNWTYQKEEDNCGGISIQVLSEQRIARLNPRLMNYEKVFVLFKNPNILELILPALIHPINPHSIMSMDISGPAYAGSSYRHKSLTKLVPSWSGLLPFAR